MPVLFLLLLLTTNIFAVTEFAVDVNCPEEDYNTITAAEDATDIDLTAATTVVLSGSETGEVGDLATVAQYSGGNATGVTATVAHTKSSQILLYDVSAGASYVAGDEWRVDESNYFVYSSGVDSVRITINIHSDDGVLVSGGTLTIAGATTDVAHYRKISVPESDRHNGLMGNGAMLAINGGYLYMFEEYLKVEWLAFPYLIYNSASPFCGIRMGSEYNVLRNCLIGNVSNSTSNNSGILLGGLAPLVHNCVLYNVDGNGIRAAAAYLDSVVYNCTIYLSGLGGISHSGIGATMSAKNCLVIGCGAGYFCYSGAALYKTTCGSSDTTGTSGLTNLISTDEFVSVGSGTKNLHLKAGATSIDAGVDLGAGYAIDINSYTRTGAWDLGADEYVNQTTSDNYSGKGLGRGIGRGVYR